MYNAAFSFKIELSRGVCGMCYLHTKQSAIVCTNRFEVHSKPWNNEKETVLLGDIEIDSPNRSPTKGDFTVFIYFLVL